MSAPEPRMCIVQRSDETVCYANAAALMFLSAQLATIAAGDAKETYHVHVRMFMENDATKFEGSPRPNVWAKDERNAPQLTEPEGEDFPADGIPFGFDVTFMHVPEANLDQLLDETIAARSNPPSP